MFTGIVEAVGVVERIETRTDEVQLTVSTGNLGLDDVAVGDSVALNGCCLTVVGIVGRSLQFDVSAETLQCTAPMNVGMRVNFEKSLRLSDRLGGHLVAGHVDAVGTVAQFNAVADDRGGSFYLAIDMPPDIARFVATKGSIAVQGVSLTVNAVAGDRFSVNLIPHTLNVTTLRDLLPGMKVNLEVDMVARYVARLAESDR